MAPPDAVAFATSSAFPESPEDDRLALDALRALGIPAVPAVWNSPSVAWAEYALVVVRSTWDYQFHPEEFLRWIDRAAAATTLWNPAPMLRWNFDKRYLLDLAREGFDTVPTERIPKGSAVGLRTVLDARGWEDVVIKPSVGAAGHGLARADRSQRSEGEAHLARLLERGDALVQPFMEAGRTGGERSMVFLDGAFSHAVAHPLAMSGDRKIPHAIVPSRTEIEGARRIVAWVTPTPLYARVDLLPTEDGRWLLGELELIEPELFFRVDPPAARRFAEVIARRLRGG